MARAYFEAHRNLAIAQSKVGELDAAVTPLERAAQLRPADPGIWTLLASLHHGRLDLPAAIACRRRALALRPQTVQAHSDLLVTLHYSPDYTPEQIFQEHLAWARAHEEPVLQRGRSGEAAGDGLVGPMGCEAAGGADNPPLAGPLTPKAALVAGAVVADLGAHLTTPLRRHSTTSFPGARRPLRIGYLSGDFRQHPMPRFLFPVLRGHDRKRVSVFCYSDVSRPDAVTAGVRALADVWRDISALDDDAAAEQVRSDGIDVLVDLAGHLENRRLLVFARRPAPVQASYIGYPNTTGMRSMQYRITDGFLRIRRGRPTRCIPSNWSACPDAAGAYDPGDDPPCLRTSAPCPRRRPGGSPFGIFNRLIKVTEATARLWWRVLRQVPGSRLAVLDSAHAGEASLRAAPARAARPGQAAEIVVYPRSSRAEYLARYRHVDIALDTFPYAGMTTTCDAAWTGVPTVTLAGETHASRGRASASSFGRWAWRI